MNQKAGNLWLICAGLLFGLYCLKVVVGKFALVGEGQNLFSINDIGEFLILFAAVICLVVAMLIKELNQLDQK